MNIFNFDVILEQWAKAYRPLSHSSIESDKHKTFFRIGELKNSNEWNRNFSLMQPLVLCYSNIRSGQMAKKPSMINYEFSLYFLKKQNSELSRTPLNGNPMSDIMSYETREELDDHVQKLITFLYELKYQVSSNNTGKSDGNFLQRILSKLTSVDRMWIQGIVFDEDYPQWSNIPEVLYNGWWCCGVMLSVNVPRKICIEETDYDKEKV